VAATAPQTSTAVKPPGRLAAAIRREPVPLASSVRHDMTRDEWSRVRNLESGREITVRLRDAGPFRRTLISADEAGILLSNFADPAVPEPVARELREAASRHPEHFARAARGGALLLGRVRITAGGVFMADRKIADLQQVIQQYTRTEITQISVRRKKSGALAGLGLIGGYFLGAMTGGYVGGVVCRTGSSGDCDTGPFLTGMVIGGVTGAAYGLSAGRREVDEVIFQVR
jgi:hypothetical protein